MTGNQLLDSHAASSTITSIGGIPTGLTEGSIVFIGPTTILAEDNANLFFDDALNFAGFGTNTPSQRVHVVGNEIITGILYGGDAVGDHLDLDPSSAANYTGRVRVGTTTSAYGSSTAVALEAWPNGLSHSSGGDTTALWFNSTVTYTTTGASAEENTFRDNHTSVGGAGVTVFGVVRSFRSAPAINLDFAVAASGHAYEGFLAQPVYGNAGGGTLSAGSCLSFLSNPNNIPAGITLSEYRHYVAKDIAGSGTISNHIGFDCEVNTGAGTIVSYRSTGSTATMRHAGAARFGSASTPTATLHAQHATTDIVRATDGTNNLFEVLQLETVVNNAGIATHDFRVETDTLTHAVFVDASTNRVGIGDSTPDNHFTVGTTSQFQVGTDGDLDRIKDVPYSWPAANAAGALNNDGAGTLSWAAPAPATHNLLSASHGDTVTNTVTRGSLVYGNTTPAWDELVIGGANTILGSDGTDVAWRAQSFIDHGALTGLADDDHTQYLRLAGRAGGQLAQGGTATGDNLDLDPSSAANYTGSVRINTTNTDYGSGTVASLVLWPNGLTHGGGVITPIKGITWESTLTCDANEIASIAQLFRASPTFTNTAGVTGFPLFVGFLSQPTFTNAQAVAATSAYTGVTSNPTFSNTGGGSWTISALLGFNSTAATIPAGTTVTALTHFIANAVAVSGALTTHVGYDCTVASGGTVISYRSTSTAAHMPHAGAAKFGANSAPDVTNGNVLELERTHALTAGVGDGQAACFVSDPGYSGAFTVTRHNYWKLENPSVSSSTITASAVLWFDANAGTHSAVVAHAGGGTPTLGTLSAPVTGDPDAWFRINVNGVIMLVPAWTP